jgi:hypothetical protein
VQQAPEIREHGGFGLGLALGLSGRCGEQGYAPR